jgi:hypothetical protein
LAIWTQRRESFRPIFDAKEQPGGKECRQGLGRPRRVFNRLTGRAIKAAKPASKDASPKCWLASYRRPNPTAARQF